MTVQATTQLAEQKNAIGPTFEVLNDGTYGAIYTALMERAKAENEGLYRAAIAKCKNKRQRESKAGYYAGRWQQLFDAWLNKKIGNLRVRECLNPGFVPEEVTC